MSFVLRVLISGVALWLAEVLLSGITIVGADTTWGRVGVILAVALVFGIVNAVVKPIVNVLSIPLYILTLGLFTLVVNALMLMLTAWITEQTSWGLRIDDFGDAFLGGLIVSVVSFALSVAIPRSRES
ncbi:phage holin family protein [Cellulomonas endometrii]|uniref:phage holin family protein n=1 Tax=Cellulomonas endometrii TaxID=3036301 RepID=UPI0024AE5E2C|nr:phage holin family protein [Cellulomonas endometrii]